jgi:hypothetical protein
MCRPEHPSLVCNSMNDKEAEQASPVVPGKPFQPNLSFVSMIGTYKSEVPFKT